MGVLKLSRVTMPTLDVLEVLLGCEEPVWGLQIIAWAGRGPGTVYPLLERLESAQWLTAQWEAPSERRGPRRRLYQLTEEGAESARAVLLAARQRPVPRARLKNATT